MQITIPNIFSDFLMIFLGLIVAAIPFIVLGVVISVLIEKYISSSWILKYKSKNPILSHIQVLFIGMLLPVCECGNIPLAKRLKIVGFKPSEVITFVLAAPIFNPIVFITTFVAFNLDPNIAYIRVFAGAFIALFIGLLFNLKNNQNDLLVEEKTQKSTFSFTDSLAQKTELEMCEIKNNSNIINIFRKEFFSVFKLLIIGASIAASFQLLIPREIFTTFSQSPTLSILALLAFAFIISICSSIDAFFALSFVGIFNLGSIISFLVFGPMIDIKSLLMLKTIFKGKTLVLLSIIAALLCLLLGLTVNYFYKINYV